MGGDFALAPWRLGVWAAAHETVNTSCFSVFLYLQRFTARCLQGGIEDARSSVDLGVWAAAHETIPTSCFSVFLYL